MELDKAEEVKLPSLTDDWELLRVLYFHELLQKSGPVGYRRVVCFENCIDNGAASSLPWLR